MTGPTSWCCFFYGHLAPPHRGFSEGVKVCVRCGLPFTLAGKR